MKAGCGRDGQEVMAHDAGLALAMNESPGSCRRRMAVVRYSSSPMRTLLRPFALGLIGLGIAIFLWGLGYKLSLYHFHHKNTLKTGVAKLWVDPHWASAVASAKVTPNGVATKSLLLPRRVESLSRHSLVLVSDTSDAPGASFLCILFRVLRSPPSQTL
jgi:hypothetical protein